MKLKFFLKIKDLLTLIKPLWLKIIIILFGIFIALYFILTSMYWGRFDTFNFLITLMGLVLIVLAFKLNTTIAFIKKWPKLVKYTLLILFACFVLSFILVQARIIYNMRDTPEAGADYVLVLGCQVVGEYASVPLLSRGYTAIRYLNRNLETKVVLSGGKGSGENISEAEALRRLLHEYKIDKERIFLEDQSRNTRENLFLSNELYHLADTHVILVTSDYHMFRALSVAKKLGYTNVHALPSRSQRSVLPAFLVREYVTVMYYAITRKI
jgi:uncharacterized SAM-binding protein YcdF (DUF218 family)